MKRILFIGLILMMILLTGCGPNEYQSYKSDCLEIKQRAYCDEHYDAPECGVFGSYRQEWYEECNMEYSGIQPAAKEHVLAIVDFDEILEEDNLMRCYDRDYGYIEQNESWHYFSIWKTGDIKTVYQEYKHYTLEIKYPEFEIDVMFPDQFEECSIRHFDIDKTITKENQTYELDCDLDLWDYDLKNIEEFYDFKYRELYDDIERCLQET